MIDATPTILSLLGLPIPGHIEGRPITGGGEAAESSLPAASIRKDSPEPPHDGPHRRPFEYTDEEQAIIEQRLADLGYLE